MNHLPTINFQGICQMIHILQFQFASHFNHLTILSRGVVSLSGRDGRSCAQATFECAPSSRALAESLPVQLWNGGLEGLARLVCVEKVLENEKNLWVFRVFDNVGEVQGSPLITFWWILCVFFCVFQQTKKDRSYLSPKNTGGNLQCWVGSSHFIHVSWHAGILEIHTVEKQGTTIL